LTSDESRSRRSRIGGQWPLLALGLFFSPLVVPAEQLFSNTPLKHPLQTTATPAKRARQVLLNPTSSWSSPSLASPAHTMELNLFSDFVVTGVLDTVTFPGPGRSLLRGHVEGQEGSYFLLAGESNVVAGTVFVPKRGTFLIQYAGGGTHTILEHDPAYLPRCGVEASASQAAASTPVPLVQAAAPGPEPRAVAGASIPVVDVLVLYTAQARDGAGGDSGISAHSGPFLSQSDGARLWPSPAAALERFWTGEYLLGNQ